MKQLSAIFCDIDDFCKAFHGSGVCREQRPHWPAVQVVLAQYVGRPPQKQALLRRIRRQHRQMVEGE